MEKTTNSENLLLFEKRLRKIVLKNSEISLKNKKKGIVIICTYAYFNGERFSQLRQTLIDEVFESKLNLKFIIEPFYCFNL